MTATRIRTKPGFTCEIINGILDIKPLANFAKNQARSMMIKRAEKMGVPWRDNVEKLRQHDWEAELEKVKNPNLIYPDYYLRSFHAYDQGNLSWDAALEVESAAYAVHAKIWEDEGINGDTKLRENYNDFLQEQIKTPLKDIVDIGCGIGMSTFALQETYPEAQITGVDLSPYFLAVAQYRAQEHNYKMNWVHEAGEKTNLPNASFDLVSSFLTFHELTQKAAKEIIMEARRLVRPNGYLAIMDMNPDSETFKKMPPYILTLLKSTEPYLDRYFCLNITDAFRQAGFEEPTIATISPRHRGIIAKAR